MTSPPKFMEPKPEPRIITRRYRGKDIQLWEGKVSFNKIKAWIGNPRIELLRDKWESDYSKEVDQDDVFQIMKDENEIELRRLAEDIGRNGLREPVVLTWGCKLLDGNRRYAAFRYLREIRKSSKSSGDDELDAIKVFALTEEATDDDADRILVEENFAPSLKKEWPDYIKAIQIRDAKADADPGKSTTEIENEIRARFGWPKTKIRETDRTLEVIDEFMAFAQDAPNDEDELGGGLGLTETQATEVANKKYQFFNEAQKDFYDPLQKDPDFKVNFFRWLYDGKFKSFVEVRIAHRAWENKEARHVLNTETAGDRAGRQAKIIIDTLSNIEQGKERVYTQTKNFLTTLSGLTLGDVEQLEPETLEDLKKILIELEKFLKMVKGVSNVK